MSKYLEGLSEQQTSVVLQTTGAVQVDATAGSGKTHTIVRRVAYMIETGIDPSTILMTTFTKKATEEMKTRLRKVLPRTASEEITVGTTHAICYRILAEELVRLRDPMARAFLGRDGVLSGWKHRKFIDEVKKLVVLGNATYQAKTFIRDYPAKNLISFIGNCKNRGVDSETYTLNHDPSINTQVGLADFYEKYEELKLKEGVIDLDDLLPMTINLFQSKNEILEKYRNKFQHIIVDEAQDSNSQQYELIFLLSRYHNNVCFVGDCDQSMYSFRGARPDTFIGLANALPDLKILSLEKNYRSSPHILRLANKLIHNNEQRLPKVLIPHKEDTGVCVDIEDYVSGDEEAVNVIQEVKTLIDEDGLPPHKIAILYRVNAQSQYFEDKLIQERIPYTIHGSVSFYKRKEINDILSYLKLAYNPKDNWAFGRIYSTPVRYLGKAFLSKFEDTRESHLEMLMNSEVRLSYSEEKGVDDLLKHMSKLRGMVAENKPPIELFNYVLDDKGVGYLKHLSNDDDDEDSEEDNDRMDNINILKDLIKRYDTVKGILDHVEEMTSRAKLNPKGVQLMTIHRSKGLEFPVVFATGWSEGLLPHHRSVAKAEETEDNSSIEEERRLAYVAMTRAESLLFISSIANYGDRTLDESRFIYEIKEELDHDELKDE